MTDQFGRRINYMRVSITDRCNLRCKYCIPYGAKMTTHTDILAYEEFLRICSAAAALGIVNFKITGGEPLVRKGCKSFIAMLKNTAGVEQVTLTTNGILLSENLDSLATAGIDGINISLDAINSHTFSSLTGYSGDAGQVIQKAIAECVSKGIKTKINTVLLKETFNDIYNIALLAKDKPVDIRYIELMPIGEGASMEGVSMAKALDCLTEAFPDLTQVNEKRGNGPAIYYASKHLTGRIGFITAVSGKFCDTCNRIRLTATGKLKPCLCYDHGTDLKSIIRNGGSDKELISAMEKCISAKPQAHCFSTQSEISEKGTMNTIGG